MTDQAKKILLIEDNEGDIRLLQELLMATHRDKFLVEPVRTLQEGMEKLESPEGGYEAVLADLSLPDSDDVNIVSVIQSYQPQMPIIVLTGRDSDELAIRVMQMGAQDYLVKGQGDGHLICRAIGYAIERKKSEQRLIGLTQYDSLTGLANRTLFRKQLNHALIRADKSKYPVALIFIDLDRFKNINDAFGYDAGDQLLKQVGQRLSTCTSDGDTIARLGGDQFTIVLEGTTSIDDGALMARKIIKIMIKPFDLEGQEVFVTPSIGITIYPHDGTEEHNLMGNADTAMCRAKELGRNGYQFYTGDMNVRAMERFTLETKLRRALDNNEFNLYYQPKINIETGDITGVEALIRWQHPTLGLVPPIKFIPIAEETGLIEPIGSWVIYEACSQNAKWQSQGYKPIRIAVNLSVRQFSRVDVTATILAALNHAGLGSEYLEVEITESMLMADTEKSKNILTTLKEHGIHISIDDFGTGYSSLNYLKHFKIDTLKIDQSFIHDIIEDPDAASMIIAIIAMGHSLRMRVVAEGVETIEQLNFLAEHGCNEVQGYYYNKPLSATEFTDYLKDRTLIQLSQ